MKSVTAFGATVLRNDCSSAPYALIRSRKPTSATHRGKEREQRAVRDLLREPHAVVRHELRERPLEDGDPLTAREPRRLPRYVPTSRGQSRSRIDQRPTRTFSCPSRPRRAKYRIVAPTPPASTKPTDAAAPATIGSFDFSLPVMSVASPSSSRRCSTAPASCSRSASRSVADLSGRAGAVRRRHQLLIASVVSLASRIACSGTGGVPFLIRLIPRRPSSGGERAEEERHDQQREPGRQERLESGRRSSRRASRA